MRVVIWALSAVVALTVDSWAATPCPSYFAELHDKQGNTLAGVNVTVVKYGTTTPATIYSDRDCAQVASNPMLSSARGEILFYARGGQYTIEFEKDNLLFVDTADIPIYGPCGEFCVPVGYFRSLDICETGDAGAIDSIGASPMTLLIDKAVTCTVNKAFPSTLTVVVTGQGSITLSSGKLLTCSSCRFVNLTGQSVLNGTGTYAGFGQIRRTWFGAKTLTADGTQCAAPAAATINSGPRVDTIICTDNNAATIYGMRRMPDSWDGGTVALTVAVVQTAADTNALHADVAAQCRGNAEVVSGTWGTEVALDFATLTGGSGVNQATSAAITPAGTCAAGDVLWWYWQVDATGTTTAMNTVHVLGFTMTYRETPNVTLTE